MSTARLRAKLAAPRTASEQTEEEKMKGKKGAAADPAEDGEGDGEDDGDGDEGKKKDVKKGAQASTATSTAKALSPEKARMKAITGSASAAMLPKLANHLAYDTDLSAEDAEAVMLAALEDVDTDAAETSAPRESSDTSPKAGAFRKAMEGNAPNPKIGTGAAGGKAEAEDPWLAAAKQIGVA